MINIREKNCACVDSRHSALSVRKARATNRASVPVHRRINETDVVPAVSSVAEQGSGLRLSEGNSQSTCVRQRSTVTGVGSSRPETKTAPDERVVGGC
jgi:hypothetical protein